MSLVLFSFIFISNPALAVSSSCASALISLVHPDNAHNGHHPNNSTIERTDGLDPLLLKALNNTPELVLNRPPNRTDIEKAKEIGQQLRPYEREILHEYIRTILKLEKRFYRLQVELQKSHPDNKSFDLYHNIAQALLILFYHDHKSARDTAFGFIRELDPEPDLNNYARLIHLIAKHIDNSDLESFLEVLFEKGFQSGLYSLRISADFWASKIDHQIFSDKPNQMLSFFHEAVEFWTEKAKHEENPQKKYNYLIRAQEFARIGSQCFQSHNLPDAASQLESKIEELETEIPEPPAPGIWRAPLLDIMGRFRASLGSNRHP